jgi:hypothetical protein
MQNTLFKTFFLAALLLATTVSAQAAPSKTTALMPRADDYTLMWWADGFPGRVPNAPWRRVTQTGRYALAVDTETLHIPHFGAVPRANYEASGLADNRAWQALPPADLALRLTANGKTYRAKAGGHYSAFGGPRLIESGRFLQRADVTDLVFAADDGTKLNVEARFETVAWADRLSLILAARPGLAPISAGEASFGRIGGGFGLDGTNSLEVPHSPELDTPQFTMEAWAFVPADYQAGSASPWLICKNRSEWDEGNYGLMIVNGRPQARLDIGGGRENAFVVDSNVPVKMEQWNHLAFSYDGDTLRLYVNGELSGERKIGRPRVPGHDGLAFGRRQDNSGDGYHFRGALDEIRFYNRALTLDEIHQRFQNAQIQKPQTEIKPVRAWSFRADGLASASRLSETWRNAAMEVSFAAQGKTLRQHWQLPQGQSWQTPAWHEVALALDPVSFQAAPPTKITVQASDMNGTACPVNYEAARGWHRINLDGLELIAPPGLDVASPGSGKVNKANDAIERVKLHFSNPTAREQTARLLFEKTAGGFRQFASSITGISAVLRDRQGNPTGIPVQLSKNWHSRPEGDVYQGPWFHGISQIHLPPHAKLELELTIAYGHWGGVPAASHAQLTLIGWGANQLWDESALGAWGESICYEPDQVQANCLICDVRPAMVSGVYDNGPWQWTNNVGGGDFFRAFDAQGQRLPPARMRTVYARQGPCLTEVTYAGRIGNGIIGDGIEQRVTVSLARTDDIVRGTYHLRLDVKKAMDFSRFVIFQIGADTYSYAKEHKMALGNETGLISEWNTQWGGNVYRTAPLEAKGRVPWVSLHEAVTHAPDEKGAYANRGIVIRNWSARLGGKKAAPWIAEHGVTYNGGDNSTLDLVLPPGVTRLEPGDFIEATIEHLIMPQFAADYYGPNAALRAALKQDQNTWRMIQREAMGNDRHVTMKIGELGGLYPAVKVGAANDVAAFTLRGGLGYIPMTFTGLTSPSDHQLLFDGRPVNQSVHGNDFWQTDFDAATQRWSLTYNLPITDNKSHTIQLTKTP